MRHTRYGKVFQLLRKPRREQLRDLVKHRVAVPSDNVEDRLGDRPRLLLVEIPLAMGLRFDFERRPGVPLRLLDAARNRARKGTPPVRGDRIPHEDVQRSRGIARLVPGHRRRHRLLPEDRTAGSEPDHRRFEQRQRVHDARRIERQLQGDHAAV
jgi:hypothetical protein